jgi:hypothetical protein
MEQQRQTLLEAIATIISDYRQGDITAIDFNHVDRWVTQFGRFGFDKNAQLIILEQMKLILDEYYISYAKAQDYLRALFSSNNFLGENPAHDILSYKFLKIQTQGNSQEDLLSLCDFTLRDMYGIGVEDCGKNPAAYIYLDDCLYSGNRVRRDIATWLPNAASGTVLHIIFFGIHTEGLKYSKQTINKAAALQKVTVKFWQFDKFHNSHWQPIKFDCFWARSISGDTFVDQYIQTVNQQRQSSGRTLPPLFRPNNMPTNDTIFSSPAAREVIEYAFLKAGAFIVSLPSSPNTSMRPLGYDYFQSLGFGAMLVTYRNIANNCPLALWWGDPDKAYPLNAWYPLFPRTVNNVKLSINWEGF